MQPTTTTRSDRPLADEHRPYFSKYIALVAADGEIASILREQAARLAPFYAGISEAQSAMRCAPDKWSIKQMVAHVMDTERVFGFRALAFSRGEQAHLPPFEQDDYVKAVDFDARSWRAIVDEFAIARAATIALFGGMTPELLVRRGIASEATLSVRACGYIIAGHEEHHVRAIREQYLPLAR